uniref:Uncharacterized protein n=1 Tax=Xiphophorus couchianus TaxID=32473 RepID=A0A3B5KR42_9TELE
SVAILNHKVTQVKVKINKYSVIDILLAHFFPKCAVWVFAIYQPNYDPSVADGLYCNKTLYTFAFWNAIVETFGFVVILAKLCKGLVCYVNLSPVDADFYRNV